MVYGRLLVMTPPRAPERADAWLTVVPSTTWNLHRNKPELRPTRNRQVVNLSGLVEQRVKSNVWKTVGIIASNRKQMIAAGVVNIM